MRWDPERSRKACYNAIAVNLFIGQNKQASLSTYISPLFHNLGAEMRTSEWFIGGAALNAGRCGSPPEQQSPWSTAIYWSSKLVQSIQEKRKGETTLEEKIAYLRSLRSGRGCIHILIGQVLYVDSARTYRARWKKMQFSTETNRKALYYFLRSVRNVMRKLAEGKKKKQWKGWSGWDMSLGNEALQARCDWVVWVRWTFQDTLLHQLQQVCSFSSAYRSLHIGQQANQVHKKIIIVTSQVWPTQQPAFP